MTETPARPMVFITTPCFGGLVSQHYMQSVLGLVQFGSRANFDVTLALLGHDSLITRSRNTLVSQFLKTPAATHLLFIDADICFEPEQVFHMLRFDREFVAGIYPLKVIDWSDPAIKRAATAHETFGTAPLLYVGTLCTENQREREGRFATAIYCGGGFMLLKRGVIERMIAAYPETRYNSAHAYSNAKADQNYALFDCMIDKETGIYVSGELAFCQRWRDIGGKIWLDTEGKLVRRSNGSVYGRKRHLLIFREDNGGKKSIGDATAGECDKEERKPQSKNRESSNSLKQPPRKQRPPGTGLGVFDRGVFGKDSGARKRRSGGCGAERHRGNREDPRRKNSLRRGKDEHQDRSRARAQPGRNHCQEGALPGKSVAERARIWRMKMRAFRTVLMLGASMSRKDVWPARSGRRHRWRDAPSGKECPAFHINENCAKNDDTGIARELDRIGGHRHVFRGRPEQKGAYANDRDRADALQKRRAKSNEDTASQCALIGEHIRGNHHFAVAGARGMENPIGET
jgi:hypothetical protein